jgi:hypothetical protein
MFTFIGVVTYYRSLLERRALGPQNHNAAARRTVPLRRVMDGSAAARRSAVIPELEAITADNIYENPGRREACAPRSVRSTDLDQRRG